MNSKKVFSVLMLSVFLLASMNIAVAIKGYGKGMSTGNSGSTPTMAAAGDVVSLDKGFHGDEVRKHIRENVEHKKVRELRDELHRNFKGEHHEKLKELRRLWKEDREHFNFDEYTTVVDDYLKTLNHLLDYLQSINPEERGVESIRSHVEHAKMAIKELPAEPTKDQIKDAFEALKMVKKQIQELKKALKDAHRVTREAGHESINEKLTAFADKLRAKGVPDDRIQECMHMADELMKQPIEGREHGTWDEIIRCFRSAASSVEHNDEDNEGA